jgi:hypothetical protein
MGDRGTRSPRKGGQAASDQVQSKGHASSCASAPRIRSCGSILSHFGTTPFWLNLQAQYDLETVEKWTIGTSSPLDHPFHLHRWPMQLLELDAQPVTDPLRLEVVNVPAGGQVTRVAFADFAGKTVYPCTSSITRTAA